MNNEGSWALQRFVNLNAPAYTCGRLLPIKPNRNMDWKSAGTFDDILYHQAEGVARIAINRPEVRNAFRPQTVRELIEAFHRAHMDPAVGAIILTGTGDQAFCSGGDQKVRGAEGYIEKPIDPDTFVAELERYLLPRGAP